MNKAFVLVALATGLIGATAGRADDDPMTVSVNRLTMDTAVTIAQGAIAACREKGIQIGVTVVDRDGLVQASLRDTIAPPITVQISRMKAYTAVNFGVATGALKAAAETPLGHLDGLMMIPGGLPIKAGGGLLGGVGVSGAASSEDDAACAQAGIDQVLDDLDMAF